MEPPEEEMRPAKLAADGQHLPRRAQRGGSFASSREMLPFGFEHVEHRPEIEWRVGGD
jgi:hypothetical protein